MKKMRIYLADDHQMFREGLKLLLMEAADIEIVGESGDGTRAMEDIEREKPDMAILDISMPGLTGIDITKKVKKYYPQIKIITLSRHDNIEYINELLTNGVDGYVLKDEASDDLKKAIDVVSQGNLYLSPRIAKHLVSARFSGKKVSSEIDKHGPFSVLTDREREVLKLIAEAKSNREIASSLWISPKTVKAHRSNIMKKLEIHNVVELVKYAVKHGIIES